MYAFPFCFLLEETAGCFSETEDAVAVVTRQSAVDQRVSGGRHLHLFSSTCQPDCICYLKSEWCFVFQQLQMRLQEKEQEVDDLIIQIQAEKVLSFFCSSLRVAPSSSELQIVQNMDSCLITVTL